MLITLTSGASFQELKLFSKPRESFRGSLVRENSRPRKLPLKKAFSATAMDLRDAGNFRSNNAVTAAPPLSYSPSESSRAAATEPSPTADNSNHCAALVAEPNLPNRGTGAWLQDAENCSNNLLSVGWKANQQPPQGQLDLSMILHVPSLVIKESAHKTEANGQERLASKWRRLPKIASEALDAPVALDNDQN
jgi:hypothetical protein